MLRRGTGMRLALASNTSAVLLPSGTERGGMSQPAVSFRPPTWKEQTVDRAAKQESITTLNGVFKSSNVVVVAHYAGLTVTQMQALRTQVLHLGNRETRIVSHNHDTGCLEDTIERRDGLLLGRSIHSLLFPFGGRSDRRLRHTARSVTDG